MALWIVGAIADNLWLAGIARLPVMTGEDGVVPAHTAWAVASWMKVS